MKKLFTLLAVLAVTMTMSAKISIDDLSLNAEYESNGNLNPGYDRLTPNSNWWLALTYNPYVTYTWTEAVTVNKFKIACRNIACNAYKIEYKTTADGEWTKLDYTETDVKKNSDGSEVNAYEHELENKISVLAVKLTITDVFGEDKNATLESFRVYNTDDDKDVYLNTEEYNKNNGFPYVEGEINATVLSGDNDLTKALKNTDIVGLDLTRATITGENLELKATNTNMLFYITTEQAENFTDGNYVKAQAAINMEPAKDRISFVDGEYPYYAKTAETGFIFSGDLGYTRIVKANSWATICVPTDGLVKINVPEGVTIYTVDAKNSTNNSIAFAKAEKMESGKAYLVKNPTSEAVNIEIKGNGNFFNGAAIEGIAIDENITFTGSTMRLTSTGNEWGISGAEASSTDLKLKKIKAGNTIEFGRAYFTVADDTQTSGVKFSFIDDETTGISSVATEKVKNNKIYNINGQVVNNMNQKGIYIVNGKKVVK